MTQPSTRRRPQGPTGSTRRSDGFTLIELMIAVAIVAILASIAYPSYTRYVQDARRADAKSTLLERAGELERCYTETTNYETCASGIFPFESDFYTFSYDGDNTSPTTYLVLAESKFNDRCDPLTLNQRGERGAQDEGCW